MFRLKNNGQFRAAFRVIGKRHSYAVFPLRSLTALVLGVACLLVVALLVENELGQLARKGLVATHPWVVDNHLISNENYRRINNTSDEPVFRSLGYAPPAAKVGRRRVLVVGDSFIWGDGLTNINQTWWRQLQWELERRGYFDVDVIAAGVNGASTQDEYHWLTDGKLLEKTQPDAVVIGYVTNDPDMKDARGKHLVKQLSGAPAATASPPFFAKMFSNLWTQLSIRRTQKLEHNRDSESGYPYDLWELKILEGENFLQYRALLKDAARTIRQAPLPIFFVTTPHAPNAEAFETRYAPVRSAFKEAGIVLHDLLPRILECCSVNASNLAWSVNPVNIHPGTRLNHFYAAQVADILEREYPALLGSRALPPVDREPVINDWLPASVKPRSMGRNAWEFAVPSDRAALLYMPVEESHLVLSFDHPVSISDLKLSAPRATAYKVWATVLDDKANYEKRDYVLFGSGSGRSISLQVPPEIASSRITSLRIATGFSGTASIQELLMLEPGRIALSQGGGYYYALTPIAGPSDVTDAPTRSSLVLLEDGHPLPVPHALHEEIRRVGLGRYSHWGDGLIFSSSDGTDPRINGRRYSVGLTESTTVRLDIKFNSPAVRQ
jgi:lysophospholipase L1-like esterase